MIKNKLKLLTTMMLTASLLFIASCSDSKDTISEKDLLTEITSVSISTNPIITSQPTIIEKDGGHVIEFAVAPTATAEDLKLALTIVLPNANCSVSPASGEIVDFSKEVTYTVTNKVGKTTKQYRAICNKDKHEGALITSFLIDETEFTKLVSQPELKSGNYEFTVSETTTEQEIKTLVPIIKISEGATITPASGVAQDFTNPVTYTVTAENGIKNEYIATCIKKKFEGALMLSMEFKDNALVETQPVITDGAIEFHLFATATPEDKVALTPTITVSEGATINPASEVAQDFTNPVTYTVTAENGIKSEYIITCIRNKFEGTSMLSMEFKDNALVETQPVMTDGAIEFHLFPAATPADIAALTPTITVSEGATISPVSGVAQDFTNPVTYTVTAESGATKDYTVTCIRNKYTEAKLISFELNSPLITVAPVLVEGSTDIEFYVSDDANLEQIAALAPETELSPGATISASKPHVPGAVVVYTITSEDGQTTITYNVVCKRVKVLYQFEEWVGQGVGKKWSEAPTGWCSSNEGATAIPSFWGPIFPIARNVDGRNGIGVNILTIETKYSSSLGIPKVTSGSMYLGAFVVDMSNKLNSTKFGIEFHEKPMKVKGYYKYSASANYWHNNVQAPAGTEVDKMSIRAVLYEVDDYTETLTGLDLTTSDKIVAVAYMSDGAEKTEFTEFELVLNYDNANGRTYDPTKKYKFSIIFASSDRGDIFYGGLGSIMVVDDVEVILE